MPQTAGSDSGWIQAAARGYKLIVSGGDVPFLSNASAAASPKARQIIDGSIGAAGGGSKSAGPY